MILRRRLLAGGLSGMLALTPIGMPVHAVSASSSLTVREPLVRDIAGPLQPAERDAGGPLGAAPSGAARPAGPAAPAGPSAPAPGGRPPAPVEPPGAPPVSDQRQGSVVAMFPDPTDPLIVISAGTGYLTVRLRCGDLCPSIHLGDYIVAEGRRRSEAVFDAVEIWVVSP